MYNTSEVVEGLNSNQNNDSSSMTMATDHHHRRNKLPLFLVSTSADDERPPVVRSPRSFEGAVGLGIVAAMMNPTKSIIPPRSDPIAIHSPRPATKGAGWGRGGGNDDDDDKEELSESYTCVISHVAGNTVKKRVYYDEGGGHRSSGNDVIQGGGCVLFYQSPLPTADFLNRCFLCGKNLHGMDIFMYRGDKAFCSSECRCQQIMSDEYRENCGSGALKSFEYSVSPLLFAAGVAAAS